MLCDPRYDPRHPTATDLERWREHLLACSETVPIRVYSIGSNVGVAWWVELADKLTLKPMLSLKSVAIIVQTPNIAELDIVLRVRNVDDPNGPWIDVGSRSELNRRYIEDVSVVGMSSEFAYQVRTALMNAYMHEVDECIRYADGKHVRDPHP